VRPLNFELRTHVIFAALVGRPSRRLLPGFVTRLRRTKALQLISHVMNLLLKRIDLFLQLSIKLFPARG